MYVPASLRRASALAFTGIVFVSLTFAQARGGGQSGGAGQGAGAGQGGGSTGGGRGTSPGSQPGQTPGQVPGQVPGQMPQTGTRPTQPGSLGDLQRSIFLSGKVIMEDGTPPPDRVLIERVCNGSPRPEAYTDSKGRFSFQLGQNAAIIADASTDMSAMRGAMPGQPDRGFGYSQMMLNGCELRANLAGFMSEAKQLTGHRPLDNPDVGTIILHRIAKVEGFTFSATSVLAPKDARKAYEKGVDRMKKEKWADAEKEFTKAVTAYDKYAAAWNDLGVVYQRQNKIEDAKRAYEQSTKADAKYINPYASLAMIAGFQQKWDDVIRYTSQVIKLNPYYSPQVYFYSAVANYNTHNLKEAEDHAREAVKMDQQHRIPKANQLLSMILEQKGNFKEAAENMRIYIKASPNANDAMTAQQHLTELEQRAGAAQP